jgi:hypothetical protein
MNRTALNFVVDALTSLVMLAILATGLIIRFVLPPGSGSWHVVWGYNRHEWGDLHFWLALAMVFLVVVHVALHWSWVCTTCLRLVRPGACPSDDANRLRRNWVGFGLLMFLLVLFAVFVWLAQRNVQELSGERRHMRSKTSSSSSRKISPTRHKPTPIRTNPTETIA